ncbi:MAG: hypothetical protein RLW61_15675 [Gammaproteobacteria bacterium]
MHAVLLLFWLTPLAAEEALNGTWALDEQASTALEDAAKAFNDELNEQRRNSRRQTFDRDSGGRSRSRFDGQVRATSEMIAEDMRSLEWGEAPLQRDILTAATLKLYVARKVAVLYDGALKRLLTINPAGRAYSVSGTEVTNDEVGRSLTYLENGQLVIETSVHGGGRMVERYRVEDGGQRLMMKAELQERRDGPWLEFEREFARAD